MKDYKSASKKSTWLKPLLLIAVASLAVTGCKNSSVQSPPPSGGMPPPSGGMPAPSGGQQGGGQQSGGQEGGGQEGGGQQGGGQQGGGQQGGGQPGGGESQSSGGEGSDGAGGIGEIPPSEQGGAGGGGADAGGGESSGGEGGGGDDNPFSDSEAAGEGECGDTGAMPGGIGGMGQEGECISDSASASESDSDSSSSASGSGGGSGAASGAGGASGGGGASGTGGAGSVGEFPEESAAERAERLGRELEESIGGFDETLGNEQREIASAGRVMEGFDTEGGGGGESSGELIDLGSQSASSHSTGGMAGGNGSAPSSPLAGMSDQEIQERTPEDVPITVDDDIIARQLREAALVEEDPDLRDRLWDEYRKYKGL